MEFLPGRPSTRAPEEMFTGPVWLDVIYRGEEPSRMRCNAVHFAPGSRTAWHRHAVGQALHVTEGVGLVRSRGGELLVVRAGDTVHTPPGEWHWHGATPENFMTHLALWEGPGPGADGPETEWGDLVTDQEYGAR